MNQDLRERREKLLDLRFKGLPMNEIVTDLSKDYNVTESAIYMDWSRRDTWIKEVTEFTDLDSELYESLSHIKKARNKALLLVYSSDNDNAKVGALRLYADMNFKIINVIMDLKKYRDIEEIKERLMELEQILNLDDRMKRIEARLESEQELEEILGRDVRDRVTGSGED